MSTAKKVLLAVGLVLLVLVCYGCRLLYVAFVDPSAAFSGRDSLNAPKVTPVDVVLVDDAGNQTTENQDPKTQKLLETLPELTDHLNILLLGLDQSEERAEAIPDREDHRTDTIILLSLNLRDSSVDMISVPRDTYADIYNTSGKWKINAAYFHGGGAQGYGYEYSCRTISMLLGVPIDYYICLEFEGLVAIVDAIGGVEYDVEVEIDGNNGIVLHEGLQTLNGEQALVYCKARQHVTSGTDTDRIARQQRFLMTVFRQLRKKGQWNQIGELYSSVQKYVDTNLNLEQIAACGGFAMGLADENLRMHTLKGEYMEAYVSKFYVLDQQAKIDLVHAIFGVTPPFDEVHDIHYVKRDLGLPDN